MCKENKTNKNKKVKQKETKEKVSPKKNKVSLLLKEQLHDPSIDVLQV
jgi:hypothetical protein